MGAGGRDQAPKAVFMIGSNRNILQGKIFEG